MAKPLLPVRHSQKELFLADIADAVLKDDMASMEHPIFSLNLKQAPGQSPVYYDFHTASLLIEPSPTHGFATIYDKDILIFAISQLMAAKNQGREISKKIEFDAVDFLKFSNKQTGGAQYRLLKESMFRPEFELYDLEKDPYETKNLADNPEYSSVRKKLSRDLGDWMDDENDLGDPRSVKRRH